MYWWALGIGIIVFGISLYLGEKQGFLRQHSRSAKPFTESQAYDNETITDNYEEGNKVGNN